MAAIAAITRQPSLDKRGFEPFDAFVDAACYCGRLGDALAPGCAEGLAKLLGGGRRRACASATPRTSSSSTARPTS